jgi:hypothetical protein
LGFTLIGFLCGTAGRESAGLAVIVAYKELVPQMNLQEGVTHWGCYL